MNPAPVFRVYRMALWFRVFALFFVAFGFLFVIASVRELPSTQVDVKPMNAVVGIVFFAVGIGLTVHAFTATIRFTQDTIELRSIVARTVLPLNAICGRREYVVRGNAESGSTRYLRLEPNDDRLAAIDFSKNGYNLDDAFYDWFNSLTDLDAADKQATKTPSLASFDQCPGIIPHSITPVNPITMMLVLQAMTFHSREFLCSPIRSLRLINSSMRMITTGSRTPFNTCDKIATLMSCASGSSNTVIAPPAISSV